MEERSNEEVRKAVSDCDILAEQFIGGYAMSAVEGMSAGKPVLSHLSWQGQDIREIMKLEECPIVDTPMDRIKQNLKKLAEDPQLRHELGRAGREYVLRYHSYDAVGKRWDSILRHVWLGEPLFWQSSARKLAA
jgi:glycosyltransferase involved in cell wall biosynthesis